MPNGTGVQRLFTHVGGRAFRSTSQDYMPPAFQLIEATKVGSNAAFTVDVTDLTPTGAAGEVRRVLVAREERHRKSDGLDVRRPLAVADLTQHWTGGVAISRRRFEYFVQAVDAAGNVAVSTNKGFYFAGATPPDPTGGIQATPESGTQTNDWFTGAAGLHITAPTGVTVEASVDGGEFGGAAGHDHRRWSAHDRHPRVERRDGVS